MPDLMVVELRDPNKWLVYEPTSGELKSKKQDLRCVQRAWRGEAYSVYTRTRFELTDSALHFIIVGYWEARNIAKYTASYVVILQGGAYLKF